MSQSDIINSRQIQWFPGHMTKTLRLMEKEIRNVDCVLQILDARIPLSSLNPEIERITAGKPHLYILNKADLADPEITKQWLAYFKSAGAGCLAMDSKQRGRATATKGLIEKELSALMERRRNRGMVGAAIRVMIVGMLIFSVVLLIQSIFKLMGTMKPTDPVAAEVGTLNPLKDKGVAAADLVMLLCVLFAALFKSCGYILCAVVLSLIIMFLIGKRNWVQMVLVSVLVPLLMWLVFYKVLTVNIPLGPLNFLRTLVDMI